jgi:hypothetical protein
LLDEVRTLRIIFDIFYNKKIANFRKFLIKTGGKTVVCPQFLGHWSDGAYGRGAGSGSGKNF